MDDNPDVFNRMLCGKEKDVVYIFQRVPCDNGIVMEMNLLKNTYKEWL